MSDEPGHLGDDTPEGDDSGVEAAVDVTHHTGYIFYLDKEYSNKLWEIMEHRNDQVFSDSLKWLIDIGHQQIGR